LESHLQWASKKHPDARKLVIAESIYSMDGDRAPLREIVELKDRHGAWLFLDEAHAVGVTGRQGRGLADDLGVAERIEIQMGTLGKALGSHGAYIAGSRTLRDFLINRARSFIFSTSPPAPVAAVSRKAIEISASPEGDSLRAALWSNLHHLQSLLDLPTPASAILPIVIGNENEAVQASAELLDSGFLVPAIRFPTVAKGSARLRITLTARHAKQDLESLAESLSRLRLKRLPV
ncbi:MAG: aminotransferase class I/II-fold pyridoxal phosphate-dependent enzyme, partial [Spartobacteria bacterium]